MTPKNTICLWFNKDAHEAARFYAATFPDSKVIAVHKACWHSLSRSQRRSGVQAQRGLFLPDRDGQSGRDGPLLERDRRQRRHGESVRLVQGPLGPLVADHPARAH
jgi:hypothetical protein